MAVKILLADKSITIQKVVEMLFSGREYEVACVSDGEAALNEAARFIPDVILADRDLPRLDGYSFAARLKENASLAQTPVILMLGRDDVLDAARARSAGILDHIEKPFESQELIGKVKKALTSAPPRLAEPVPPPPPPQRPAAASPARPAAAAPKQSVPSDIFDIIREAPSEIQRQPAAPQESSVFEVEPEIEIEGPFGRSEERVLPTGPRAVEEIREGLGLGGRARQEPSPPPEITTFENLDSAVGAASEYMPPPREPARPAAAPPGPGPWQAAQADRQPAAAGVSEDMVRGIAEEAVVRVAREVLEKVAWEVIPDLAERLIREEIERLKAGM